MTWPASLERVQGGDRSTLEEFRMKARVAVLQKSEAERRVRYEEGLKEQRDFLQKQSEAVPARSVESSAGATRPVEVPGEGGTAAPVISPTPAGDPFDDKSGAMPKEGAARPPPFQRRPTPSPRVTAITAALPSLMPPSRRRSPTLPIPLAMSAVRQNRVLPWRRNLMPPSRRRSPTPLIPLAAMRGGTMKPAVPAAEAAKPDAAKPDAAKPDAADPFGDAAPAKPAPAKPDAAKPAPAKPDAAKPDAAKPDLADPFGDAAPAKPDAAKPDAPAPDAAKPDAAKPDAAKPAGDASDPFGDVSPAKPDAAKPDAATPAEKKPAEDKKSAPTRIPSSKARRRNSRTHHAPP